MISKQILTVMQIVLISYALVVDPHNFNQGLAASMAAQTLTSSKEKMTNKTDL
ncbi:MAG: hypothetical protein ABG776_05695 [Cyanobacteria bacterium J06555_13]